MSLPSRKMSLVDIMFALYETEGTLSSTPNSIQNVGMCLHRACVTERRRAVLAVLFLSALSLSFVIIIWPKGKQIRRLMRKKECLWRCTRPAAVFVLLCLLHCEWESEDMRSALSFTIGFSSCANFHPSWFSFFMIIKCEVDAERDLLIYSLDPS